MRKESGDLSPREMQVATLVWKGYRETEIAAELGITPATVKRHKKNIFDRTGMGSSVELALWVERNFGEQTPAPSSAHFRIAGASASFTVRAVQTPNGPELQIEAASS